MKRRAALALLSVIGLGCETPLVLGEARYREGDRRGALEIWRAAPEDDREQPAIARRITEVQAEFAELVRGYQQSAQQLEHDGRLAEAILDRRLALELQPDDRDSWDRVQRLAREGFYLYPFLRYGIESHAADFDRYPENRAIFRPNDSALG